MGSKPGCSATLRFARGIFRSSGGLVSPAATPPSKGRLSETQKLIQPLGEVLRAMSEELLIRVRIQ